MNTFTIMLLVLVGMITLLVLIRIQLRPMDRTREWTSNKEERKVVRSEDVQLDRLVSAVDPEVIQLIKQRKKINAIKRVRELYDLGLADAKKYVDKLEDHLL